MQTYEYFTDMFIGFYLIAVLVICIERYLGAYYPFFHRTSLTRRGLLILLAVLFLLPIIFGMNSLNDLATSYAMVVGIFFLILFPSFLFLNCKLFMISRKLRREIPKRREITRRRENTSLPETWTLHFNLKNTSTCLLSVGCLFVTYFPAFFFIAFNFAQKSTSENTRLAMFWTSTMANANSTLNCLIFFWKDDLLRREGMKAVIAFSLAGFKFGENTIFRLVMLWTRTVSNANSTMNCLIFFWKNDVLRREGKKAIKALSDRLKLACCC